MYESFYGLNEKPFSLLPDPAFLYPSRKHCTVLTMFEYAMTNVTAGFTVLTGEVGAGKTTLIRQLLSQLDDSAMTIGMITNPHSSFGSLLQWVSMAFGIDYKDKQNVELYDNFVSFVVEQYRQGRRTVLIVDEAQNLSTDMLEELRMLSNINADKHMVLQLVLAGQPELRDALGRPDLRQFVQRISVTYHLDALSEAETAEYVRHRLTKAGGRPDLFEPGALGAIWRHSKGVPRLINTLCDTALVYGFSDSLDRIGPDIVEEVVRDRSVGLPVTPDNENLP